MIFWIRSLPSTVKNESGWNWNPRNDLSRICKTGSVKINKLKSVEEYRDLYHYVTEIKGKLKKNVSNHDIVSAMMPGGS